jgi:hypothetical protein
MSLIFEFDNPPHSDSANISRKDALDHAKRIRTNIASQNRKIFSSNFNVRRVPAIFSELETEPPLNKQKATILRLEEELKDAKFALQDANR